jgi:uncharacterized protein (DUF2141 family)
MLKVRGAVTAFALALACTGTMPVMASGTAGVGPFARACESGAGAPAMLVHVTGFKTRTGTVRVQLYGGNPDRYFEKGAYLHRIDLQVPHAGALDVCVPAPTPGAYAVSVRHDVEGTGKIGREDGGGMSGNPALSLFDIMFKRKPAPEKVAVQIGRGVRVVPVVLNYVEGLSFRPVQQQSD